MPPERGWKLRISDILDAIAAIQEYTAVMDLSRFTEDRKTVDAVVRNFTIIGEAALRIPEQVITENPEIPWRLHRQGMAEHIPERHQSRVPRHRYEKKQVIPIAVPIRKNASPGCVPDENHSDSSTEPHP